MGLGWSIVKDEEERKRPKWHFKKKLVEKLARSVN